MGWWNSHGLDQAGSFVLKRTLPRTWRSAALELDVLSARRRHDDALSSRRSALHLFSDELPFRRWAAAWLSKQKTSASGVDELLEELGGWDGSSCYWNVFVSGRAGLRDGETIGNGLLLGRVVRF